jgi:hypothetical protein
MENKLRQIGIAKLSESKKLVVFRFEGGRCVCFIEDLFELVAGHRVSINLYTNHQTSDVLSVQPSLVAVKSV